MLQRARCRLDSAVMADRIFRQLSSEAKTTAEPGQVRLQCVLYARERARMSLDNSAGSTVIFSS